MHTLSGALASSAPLRETFSRVFFLAKPQRAQRPAYPRGALAFSAPLREPHFSRDIFSRQAAKGAKACILLRYPVLGRASCPPSKNDPTYLEKHHYHFEMPPPLGKSVEHYLWKGMKPFPALAPPALKHVRMKLFSGSR